MYSLYFICIYLVCIYFLCIYFIRFIQQPTEEDPDEGIKDLVEITLKKMDLDHDGRLSYQDYSEAVRNEPLLLEAFGPCLPSSWVSVSIRHRCIAIT